MPRPPRRADANDPAGQGDDGATATRLLGLESRVAVAEKSTRALLVEVVRLQAALSAAMKSVDEERSGLRDVEYRMKLTADALTQAGTRLEREQQRRQTDDEDSKSLLVTARNAEAAAQAARQEAVKRAEEQSARYLSTRNRCMVLSLQVMIDRSKPSATLLCSDYLRGQLQQ